jgi:hypothetical protein
MGKYNKFNSRKWKLVLLVLILATLGFLAPPLLSAWVFKAAEALVLITGTEWVSVVTLVVSAYFGANVFQKKIENGSFTFSAGSDAEIKTTTKIDDKKKTKTVTSTIKANEEGEA